MRFETQTNLYGDIPLAERFKALDTQFAITQGHIDALISETELQELLNGDKTMYSAMNDIKIDVNGLRANLTSLTTEVDGEHGITAINNKLAEYEGTIDGFSANFERITEVVNHTGYNSYTEAVQAKIDAGIDGFNSTIQSTYYTKNDVYTKSEVNSELQGVSGAFTSAISNVQSQIDNKIETWCRDGVPTASNYPASNWTTTVLKDQHIGDLYYDTKNGYAYQYTKQNNVYSWNVITTSGIGDALTIAGNKKRVFVTQPTPPYEIGDLWVQGSSGDILRCGTARASGSYNSSDWVKASKYTDDTKANQVATNLANNYSTTTQIQQNSNGIITTAISNVDGANFISQINQTAESISINADKINLSGYTTINGNFSIDDYGRLSIISVSSATISDGKPVLSIRPSNDTTSSIDFYDYGGAYVSSLFIRPYTGNWPISSFGRLIGACNYTQISYSMGIVFTRHDMEKYSSTTGDYSEIRIATMGQDTYFGNVDNPWDKSNMRISDAYQVYATGAAASWVTNFSGTGMRICLNSYGTSYSDIGCFAILGKNRGGPLFTVVDIPKTTPEGQSDFYSSINLVNLFGNLNMGTHEVRNCYKYSGKWLALYQNYTDSTPEIRNTTMSTSIRNAAIEIINGPRLARCLLTPYGLYFQRRTTTSDSWTTQKELTMYDKSKDNP